MRHWTGRAINRTVDVGEQDGFKGLAEEYKELKSESNKILSEHYK